MAHLSAAAGAAVLRAARMGVAQVEFPSDFAIGVRELVGTVSHRKGLERKRHHESDHGCVEPKGAWWTGQ